MIQAASFVMVGLIAGAVNVLARILISTKLSYPVAVALAFPCGLVVAYVLNRQFVFSAAAKPSGAEFLRFAVVNVAALAQVWVVSVVLAEYVFPALNFHWHAETIAHTIGVGSPIITSFFAYKLFVFRVNEVASRQQ